MGYDPSLTEADNAKKKAPVWSAGADLTTGALATGLGLVVLSFSFFTILDTSATKKYAKKLGILPMPLS